MNPPPNVAQMVMPAAAMPVPPTAIQAAPVVGNRFGVPEKAPRRFKTAFIFFSSTRHKEIKEELAEQGKTEKTTTIAKMVSKEWRSMSPEEREIWEEKSRNDKSRYEAEMQVYNESRKTKRTKKDPDAPKRPMSAFLAFSNQRRRALKRDNPHATNADLSKMLSKQWKEATPEFKAEFVEEEAKKRAQYKIDIVAWRKKKSEEMKLMMANSAVQQAKEEKERMQQQQQQQHHPDASLLASLQQNARPNGIYGTLPNNGLNLLGSLPQQQQKHFQQPQQQMPVGVPQQQQMQMQPQLLQPQQNNESFAASGLAELQRQQLLQLQSQQQNLLLLQQFPGLMQQPQFLSPQQPQQQMTAPQQQLHPQLQQFLDLQQQPQQQQQHIPPSPQQQQHHM